MRFGKLQQCINADFYNMRLINIKKKISDDRIYLNLIKVIYFSTGIDSSRYFINNRNFRFILALKYY